MQKSGTNRQKCYGESGYDALEKMQSIHFGPREFS
jgi:hypothetical protein